MNIPQLSIIIPTYNNKSYLKTAIDSIIFSTKLSLEIIIVDDASEEEDLKNYFLTDKVFKYLKIFKIIRNEVNSGFIKSVNKAIQYATSENILILNNDVFVPPTSLEKMLLALNENSDFGAVGPCSNFVLPDQYLNLSYEDPSINALELAQKVKLLNITPPYSYPTYLSGFCIMIKKSVINKVLIGNMLFDEVYGFGYVEDCDLCLRISQLNYKLAIVKNSYVHHYGTRTFKNQNQADLLEKNSKIFKDKWHKV